MRVLSKKPLCFKIEREKMFEYARMDVHFFHPRFIEVDTLLKKSKYPLKRLSELATLIKDGPHHTPEFVEKGVIFLQKGDVTEGRIDLERPKKITPEFHKQNPLTQAHPGDILIRKIGVGPREAEVVPEKSPPLHIFVTLALIRLKKEFNPYYIEIFLNSSFGRAQTERRNKGIGSPCLHLEDITEITIPIPSQSTQENIVRTITKALQQREKNFKDIKELRKELENFFLEELGLKYPKEKEENIFSSEIEERFDPYYYHPRFKRMADSLKKGKFDLKQLKEVATLSNEQIDPRKKPDRLFKYIQIQDIDEVNHEICSSTSVYGQIAPGRARMLIKEGDILVPVLGGSLGSIAIVPQEFDKEVATNGFAILRVTDKELRHYVFYYLTTKFAQMQIERQLTGAIMSSISKSELENLLIPIPTPYSVIHERITPRIKEVNKKNNELQSEIKDIINKSKEKAEQLMLGLRKYDFIFKVNDL